MHMLGMIHQRLSAILMADLKLSRAKADGLAFMIIVVLLSAPIMFAVYAIFAYSVAPAISSWTREEKILGFIAMQLTFTTMFPRPKGT
jgi:hypothetical protein